MRCGYILLNGITRCVSPMKISRHPQAKLSDGDLPPLDNRPWAHRCSLDRTGSRFECCTRFLPEDSCPARDQLSRNGASGNPGAIQSHIVRRGASPRTAKRRNTARSCERSSFGERFGTGEGEAHSGSVLGVLDLQGLHGVPQRTSRRARRAALVEGHPARPKARSGSRGGR
jgi:hypothetical protein